MKLIGQGLRIILATLFAVQLTGCLKKSAQNGESETAASNSTTGGKLKIVCLDVSHGDSTFIMFPNGKTALIDSGQNFAANQYVIPFLRRHNINKLDYYVATHYHGDHVGEMEKIKREFNVGKVWDYNTFATGTSTRWEGLEFDILNSATDGPPNSNEQSLAFRLVHNGFVFGHGGDIYGVNQQNIMQKYPDKVRNHVYRTNHHMHGSVDYNYLVKTDPYLFVTSAEKSVYDRMDYKVNFLNAVNTLKSSGRLEKSLITLEAGHIYIEASGGERNQWSYTTFNNRDAVMPGLSGGSSDLSGSDESEKGEDSSTAEPVDTQDGGSSNGDDRSDSNGSNDSNDSNDRQGSTDSQEDVWRDPYKNGVTFPWCTENATDIKGEWGWENNASCHVRPGDVRTIDPGDGGEDVWRDPYKKDVTFPWCTENATDIKGDWGWENNASCHVR
jgi:beta-lactamase superfamily II metal-dependent hydrolase